MKRLEMIEMLETCVSVLKQLTQDEVNFGINESDDYVEVSQCLIKYDESFKDVVVSYTY